MKLGDADDRSLFPHLPLFAGVLITAADVLIILVFFRSSNGRQGMLFFEIVIVSLVCFSSESKAPLISQVIAVFASFMVLLKLVSPDWKEVFLGLVPSPVGSLDTAYGKH